MNGQTVGALKDLNGSYQVQAYWSTPSGCTIGIAGGFVLGSVKPLLAKRPW